MTDRAVSTEWVDVEVKDGGLMVRYDGGNRFITEAEVALMCATDDPVVVR